MGGVWRFGAGLRLLGLGVWFGFGFGFGGSGSGLGSGFGGLGSGFGFGSVQASAYAMPGFFEEGAREGEISDTPGSKRALRRKTLLHNTTKPKLKHLPQILNRKP